MSRIRIRAEARATENARGLRAVELREQGKTFQEIADVLGYCSRSAARKAYARAAGIDLPAPRPRRRREPPPPPPPPDYLDLLVHAIVRATDPDGSLQAAGGSR